MSKVAIKLLSYLGLLDIPEEKLKKYLRQYKPRRGIDSVRREVLDRERVRRSRKTEDDTASAVVARKE